MPDVTAPLGLASAAHAQTWHLSFPDGGQRNGAFEDPYEASKAAAPSAEDGLPASQCCHVPDGVDGSAMANLAAVQDSRHGKIHAASWGNGNDASSFQ